MRVQRMVEDAVVRTEKADHRTQKLNFLLKAWLSRIPGPLDFDSLKDDVPDLDLGVDAEPLPVPKWEAYAPKSAGIVDRVLHRGAEHRRAVEQAEKAFSNGLERYRHDETARKARVERMRREHEDAISLTHKQILEANAEIEDLERRVLAGERQGASEYFRQVFEPIADKPPFPRGRRFGYVPESKLLVIEWEVPEFHVVPREKEYRYNKNTDQVEVYKWRPIGEVRETYRDLLAQLAVRAIKTAFSTDPNWLVETVVFNGVLPAPEPDLDDAQAEVVDEEMGDPVRTEPACLISMRVTRHNFHRLDLKEIEPLETVRKRFAAAISRYPDELVEVDPLLSFELADPELDAEPQLPELEAVEPEELERLIENLLERMGFATELRQSNEGRLDFLASLDTGQGKELHIVHVRQTGPVADPADVRELYHVVRRERAEVGALLITGGFDPRSFEYANGKPLQLIDGTSLLGLCHQHGLSIQLDSTSEPDVEPATDSAEAPAEEPPDDDHTDTSGTGLPHQRMGGGLPMPLRIGR